MSIPALPLNFLEERDGGEMTRELLFGRVLLDGAAVLGVDSRVEVDCSQSVCEPPAGIIGREEESTASQLRDDPWSELERARLEAAEDHDPAAKGVQSGTGDGEGTGSDVRRMESLA